MQRRSGDAPPLWCLCHSLIFCTMSARCFPLYMHNVFFFLFSQTISGSRRGRDGVGNLGTASPFRWYRLNLLWSWASTDDRFLSKFLVNCIFWVKSSLRYDGHGRFTVTNAASSNGHNLWLCRCIVFCISINRSGSLVADTIDGFLCGANVFEDSHHLLGGSWRLWVKNSYSLAESYWRVVGACFIAWVGTTDLYMRRSANTEIILSSLQLCMRCWSPNVSSRTIPHHGSDINRTNSKSNYAALVGYSHDLLFQRHRDQVNPSLGLGRHDDWSGVWTGFTLQIWWGRWPCSFPNCRYSCCIVVSFLPTVTPSV